MNPTMTSHLTVPRIFLFDWDNTLIDTQSTIERAFRRTCEAFNQPYIGWHDPVYRNGRSSRESFLLIFKDRAAEVEACYRKFYQEELPEALHWMPYAEALVRALAQRADILLGVVSNKMGPQLRREIQHAGVESLFQVIVGAQDAPANKPSPDPVHYALDLMGDQAGLDVWFVGDSPIDLECAHRSGCTSILVGPMVETAYAPHYHATSMEKLQLAVDSLLPASD